MISAWYTVCFTIMVIIHDAESIVDGVPASTSQFPYMASIWLFNEPICAGGIIDAKHILTAAHCIHDYCATSYSVVVGVIKLDDSAVQKFTAIRVQAHPQYQKVPDPESPNVVYKKNDIAVVTLAQSLQWSPTVRPLEFTDKNTLDRSCASCTIAGWGSVDEDGWSNELRWTDAKIHDDDYCLETRMYLLDNEFCSGDVDETSCAGFGDSGAPFVCDGKTVGIVVAGNADPDEPDVNLMVYPYLEFIKQSVKN